LLSRPANGRRVSLLCRAGAALFDRPHDAIRREPVGGPAAWRGAALARTRDWIVPLDAAAIDELERAATAVRRRGLDLRTVRRDDFPLPRLEPAIRSWAHELTHGRGFLVVRGLPVERWSEDESSLVYWGLGLHLGTPGAQNLAADLLGHVVDTGEDAADPFVRRYRTAGDIAFHCDLADAVGLLCLRTAKRGGASRIVSSVTVYDELVRRRPDLIDRLYEPVALDRRDEARSGPGWVPAIPCRWDGDRLRTFYHSDYFRSAARHPDAPVGPSERELFDVYESIANEPGIAMDMQFEPGDIQLVSNHVILHARTAYEDWPDPTRKRHLLRLWLTLR
jgi:hypothetical protein